MTSSERSIVFGMMESDADLIGGPETRATNHLARALKGDAMIPSRSKVTRPVTFIFTSLAAATIGAGPCTAGDVKAGRMKAQMCQACHGLDGLSKVPDAPNIAGQIEPYLTAQLQAFKSGARKNDAMSLVVANLSDKDIDDLAAYFSAVEIIIGKLPAE
jgi:cytochrome c553